MTGWDDVAAAALLGTARRTLSLNGLPEQLRPAGPDDDASRQLLDVAALATVYRRAGMKLLPRRDLPARAERDERPPVPVDARNRLYELLTRNDPDLLAEWLRVSAERGLAPPARALPALLELAARNRGLAAAVATAAGPRGAWLAAFRPRWQEAIGLPRHTGTGTLPSSGGGPATWELGSPAERRQWLTALRQQDPEAARDLLATGWPTEGPRDRIDLIAVLATGLTGRDEPFLELCLADRRAEVRATAAELLTRLPESAYVRRAQQAARDVVRVEGGRISVDRPAGSGSASVLALVAAAPLRTWPGDAPELEVEQGWAATLWQGWAAAAAREQDAGWAATLIARQVTPASSSRPDPARAERARGESARGESAKQASTLVSAFGAPWPPVLAAAVLDWLHVQGEAIHEFRPVLELAAHRLPVGPSVGPPVGPPGQDEVNPSVAGLSRPHGAGRRTPRPGTPSSGPLSCWPTAER